VTEQFGRFSGQPSLLDRIGCRLSLAHDVLGRELPQVHFGHSQIDAKITMPPSSSVPIIACLQQDVGTLSPACRQVMDGAVQP
jgi:hypothetical protein